MHISWPHALQIYCYYDGTREVAPGYKRSAFDDKPFGVHMDVAGIMAKQVRIERQDEAAIGAASFDRFAANVFQQYVQAALGFSIQRGGVLYGHLDEEGQVLVDVIYEPPQTGKAEQLQLDWKAAEVRASLPTSHARTYQHTASPPRCGPAPTDPLPCRPSCATMPLFCFETHHKAGGGKTTEDCLRGAGARG